MAAVGDLSLNATAVWYDAFVATLLAEVRAGTLVNLTGFGRFSRLRFTASRESYDFLDKEEIPNDRVPGTRRTFALPEEQLAPRGTTRRRTDPTTRPRLQLA